MKKIRYNSKAFLVFLMVIALTFAFTACGGGDTDGGESASASQSEGDSHTHEPAEESPFSGQVLLDEEDIKVTAVGLEEVNGETLLRMNIENNLDQPLWVGANNISVNDYMMEDPFLATYSEEGDNFGGYIEVPASSSGDNYGIVLSQYDLEMRGIEEIGDIELTLFAGKEEMAEDYMGEAVILHNVDVDQAYNETGTVLLDNEDAKVVALGVRPDDFFGSMVDIYVYNKSDKNIYVSMENATVDGTKREAFFGSEVAAGKHSVAEASFEGLGEGDEIKQLKCTIVVGSADTDNWGEEISRGEEVTVDF